jgi:5-formyltetrahydrofolate cyclo-ligase
MTRFDDKAAARRWVWDALEDRKLAGFPFPPHGRIPNFVDAQAAAERLFRESPWRDARAIKVNPDSPQLAVRLGALKLGVRVYVPTPRLQGGFNLLDPQAIPPERLREAATLSSMHRWARPVPLEHMPPLDAIVTGCAAVTATGKRAGKGEGYSDLEYAILRELGFAPVPVATTVHDVQVVEDFPVESNDLPLTLICTPTRTIRVSEPLPAPERVEWERLNEADLDAMPILRDLRALQSGSRHGARS